MQHGSAFGWLLAGAFCASVSCGGGSSNGTAPKGFGLSCASDKDCTTYDLLCGDAGKCVECMVERDCRGNLVCAAGQCQAPRDCDDSRDCSKDQVCDDLGGVCVDCLSNRDCKTGLVCSSHSCVMQQKCDFTSDCDGGLVCDAKARVCVTCRTDDDCGGRDVCVDDDCVSPASGGSGSGGKGAAGTSSGASGGDEMAGTGAGGKTTAGSSAGGTESGGSGGQAGAGGKGGSGGNGGSGGTVPGCECAGSNVCAPDQRCVAPTLIDDVLDCNNEIISIEGRKGDWAAAADTGINLMHGFTDPGSGWSDHTCAAWATGGELTVDDPNATFAFIGFRLNVSGTTGLAYDLSDYSGLRVLLESDNSVQVVLKTIGGGYFQVTLPPYGTVGSHLRTASFSSMLMMNNSLELTLDLSTVYEIQFSVTTPQQFGLAVHRVELY